jgi:hypothetical protein
MLLPVVLVVWVLVALLVASTVSDWFVVLANEVAVVVAVVVAV